MRVAEKRRKAILTVADNLENGMRVAKKPRKAILTVADNLSPDLSAITQNSWSTNHVESPTKVVKKDKQ